MSAPHKIEKCRLCGNPRLREILDLGDQALTGCFLRPDHADPTVGPLQLVLCDGEPDGNHCGLLQLGHTYDFGEMYNETYGYRSAQSQTMLAHLRDIVRNAVEVASPRPGDAVLDIGCNDGTLLGYYEGMGLKRHGVDPSSGRFKSEYPSDVSLLVDFFTKDKVTRVFGDGKYRIITSIAMLYDLVDPMAFMRDVRDLLTQDGVWISEQSHMGTMLTNLAFDSVCHEHLEYYNLRQIQWMAECCGLKLLDADVNTINGSSFRVTFAHADSPLVGRPDRVTRILDEERKAGFETLRPFQIFEEHIVQFRSRVRDFFSEARKANQMVLGYGASTKGNVVLQYCGVTQEEMPAIAEKYSWKVGLVAPGTRIPIISEDEARARNPDYFFVLPWHFRDEIVERERSYLERGGALVFALPRFEIVRKDSIDSDDETL